MKQLKFEGFGNFFPEKDERRKELPNGEVIFLSSIQKSEDILYIKFLIKKPDEITVEKVFIFNLNKPYEEPKVFTGISSAPEGSRVFDSEREYRTACEISYDALSEIKKIADTILKNHLKGEEKQEKGPEQLKFQF
jgi:hypothetical protein